MPDTKSAAPTRIFLVRHGATHSTAEDMFSGDLGVELSETGRWQAAQLGARLREEKISAVYSSSLSRAIDTARIVKEESHAAEIQIREGLREISHGHWEGLERSDVERRYREEYLAWEEDPYTFAPEGGESGVAVLARALPVLREIVTRHEGEHVLVVSHKATIRLLLCSLLGIEARGYRDRLDQSPAALNVLDFRDVVRARLMLFNDTSHYENQPQTPLRRLSSWWDSE